MKIRDIINKIFVYSLIIVLISSSILIVNVDASKINSIEKKIIAKEKNQLEISAGSDFYIKFNSQNKKFEYQDLLPYSTGLTDNEINAVAKTPIWIQRSLIRQLKTINNSAEYINLILNSDKRYTDEIAFSIAHSPLGNVPSAELIEANVKNLYEIDSLIEYSDIIDYDNGDGDYYSTIRYWVYEDNTSYQIEYPKDVYYWYIVHPRINREEPMLVYNKTWREYLFYHNDVGHPLIREQIDDVKYLWDSGSSDKKTGISAIGYWIANNIRYEIIGDRPGQPNNIAHEHTGYCGETQKLVVAAYRSALIPINGVMNYAEDHVWCEFFDRNWYHIDGAVNNPYMYTDGWGKDMSSIWAWNGDSSIYEVTSKYIHPEDRITVEFNVRDGYNNPIDGAIVTVFVKGLKDITWYKDYFLDIIDQIWLKIPSILKSKILNKLYEKILEKIDGIDEVIEASQVSIWNYTDLNGICKFQLGKNDEYFFLIQKPDIRYPWPISNFNRIKILSKTEDITYDIHFPDYSNRITKHNNLGEIQGDFECNLNLNISYYQLQRNILTTDIGMYNFNGSIDFFILDNENFELYKEGKKFNCYNYQQLKNSSINFNLDENDYYLVFRNPTHNSNVIIDFEIDISTKLDIDGLEIISPSNNIFINPIFPIGTIVNISGISTDNMIKLEINNITKTINVKNCYWHYHWNTGKLEPKSYLINAIDNKNSESITIKLIDNIPPNLNIISPGNFDIFENEIITIFGNSLDNFKIDKTEIRVDNNNPITIYENNNWSYDIDLSTYNLGEHSINIKAYDKSGLTNSKELLIIKNDSNMNYSPSINDLFIKPENPVNSSNIIFFCNVTSDSPFSIKKVVIYCQNGSEITSNEIYRYGDFPHQSRHIEDNIQDIPNDSIFGIELGKFETGDNILCWMEAYDSANNINKSTVFSFFIN